MSQKGPIARTILEVWSEFEITYPRLRESRADCTAAQYSDASTVHGIGYIFERGQAFLPRFAWVLFVTAATAAGVTWSIQVRTKIYIVILFLKPTSCYPFCM